MYLRPEDQLLDPRRKVANEYRDTLCKVSRKVNAVIAVSEFVVFIVQNFRLYLVEGSEIEREVA